MALPSLAERLEQAQLAYHQLAMGMSVVEVKDSNGEAVRYQAASMPRLASYIAELQRQLGDTTSGPLQVFL